MLCLVQPMWIAGAIGLLLKGESHISNLNATRLHMWQLSDDIIVTHDQPIIIIVLQIKTPFSQSATQFMQLLQQCLCVNIRITIRYDLNQNILQQHLQVSQDIHHTVVLFKTQGGI